MIMTEIMTEIDKRVLQALKNGTAALDVYDEFHDLYSPHESLHTLIIQLIKDIPKEDMPAKPRGPIRKINGINKQK